MAELRGLFFLSILLIFVLNPSSACFDCLSAVGLKNSSEKIYDIDGDGVIGCKDVICHSENGTVVDHDARKEFFDCVREDETSVVQFNHDLIIGDILDMAVVNGTIYVVSPMFYYTLDETTLNRTKFESHPYEESAFLFISPPGFESDDHEIRVCGKQYVPIDCINVSGEKEDDKSKERQVKKFSEFLESKETKNVIKNSITQFIHGTLLIVPNESRYLGTLKLIHPLYDQTLEIKCSEFYPFDFGSFALINFHFDPHSRYLNIFTGHTNGAIYTSRAKIDLIEEGFESGDYCRVGQRLCNFWKIPKIRNAQNGISIGEDSYIFSFKRAVPIMVENYNQITQFNHFWEMYDNHDDHKVRFVSSNQEGSQVFGYHGSKIFRITMAVDRKNVRTRHVAPRTMTPIRTCSARGESDPVPIWNRNGLKTAVISLFSFFILFLLIASLIFIRHKLSHKISPQADIELNSEHSIPYIRSGSIEIISNLGGGHFGDVKRGWLKDIAGQRTDVAIKSLKKPDTTALKREGGNYLFFEPQEHIEPSRNPIQF